MTITIPAPSPVDRRFPGIDAALRANPALLASLMRNLPPLAPRGRGTVLSAPTRVDQLKGGGKYPNEDCAEACVACILSDAGHPEPVSAVENFDAQATSQQTPAGPGPATGSLAPTYLPLLAQSGINAQLVSGPIRQYVTAALSRSHRCIAGIYSDCTAGKADPSGNVGGPCMHAIVVYGFDGDSYYTMNPAGGRWAVYPAASVEASDQKGGIEIMFIMPDDAPVNIDPQPDIPIE